MENKDIDPDYYGNVLGYVFGISEYATLTVARVEADRVTPII